MKKITFLLVALCATVFANAADYTLTMSDYAATSFTSAGGIVVAAEQATGVTPPAYNATAFDLRVYANNTLTITSPEAMTSISFGISPKGKYRLAPLNANVGSVEVKGDPDFTAVWTGNAKTVTFTVGAQADYGKDGSAKAGQLCFTTLDIVTNGEGGGTVDPTDPTETAMTGFNYVDAIYFTSENAGYWALDLYNDYDYDNSTYVYPELYMEVAANGSSTISGTYNVDYALFYTSATDSVEFVAGSLTVSALGTIDGDGFPEYKFEGSFEDASGNVYTVSLNKGVSAYNYDTDEDITLNDDVAIRNIEVLNNVFANQGRIYTEETARIYTITGLDVTSMNGNLEGLYIVKAGNKVAKVMVTK